jgi:drug/metabolite transporter (DMT)-like permease
MSAKLSRTQAIFFLILTAILWSFGGLLIKIVSWNPIAIAGMRSAIASIFILIYLRRPRLNWSRNQILGALFYAATVILFVYATKKTTAANAILLQYSAPIYVALLGHRILGEKTSRLDWIIIFTVIVGMMLFFFDQFQIGNVLGNIVAILSGVTFALLTIYLRSQKDASPLESVLMGNILTALIAIPFMLTSAPGKGSWLGLILLGLFQIGLAYILYSIAIKYVTALEGSLIPIIEPILNPIWVFLALGEKPSKWALIGGSIIIVAMILRYLLPALMNKKQKTFQQNQKIPVNPSGK